MNKFPTTGIAHWIAVKRYRWAVFMHACWVPIRGGDKSLGSGEQRHKNIQMMMDRWDAKEPKPEDFGLPLRNQTPCPPWITRNEPDNARLPHIITREQNQAAFDADGSKGPCTYPGCTCERLNREAEENAD